MPHRSRDSTPPLAASSNHNATSSDHRIIYDKSKGSLWYDADGKGSAAAVQFAQLGTTTSHLTNIDWTDFQIV